MIRQSLRLIAAAAMTAVAFGAQASIADDIGGGLQSTEWRLVAIGLNPVTAAHLPTLHLNADGSVGGSTGCNTVKSTYNSDGSNLVFGPVGQTRKYCAAAFETERLFVGLLDKVRGYEIDNGTLKLTGFNGEVLATFRAN